MAEYIELTEELILSMRAGARAISNTKKYHGIIYMSDVFSDNPKEMPYLKAAEILYAASEKESEDVAPVRHGKWNVEWDAERDQKRLFVRIVCSNCGLKTGQKSNYCPNCGARMDFEV